MKYKLVNLQDDSTRYVSGWDNAIQAARRLARETSADVLVKDPEGRTNVLTSDGHRCATIEELSAGEWSPVFSPWRHGGWYVDNVRYPSGAVGCVSRNYADKRWRIVCDSRENAHELYTYPSRDAAARAERALVAEMVPA